MGESKRWTEGDISRLKRFAGTYKLAEIAQKLGRTERAVRFRAGELKLSLRVDKPVWTEEELVQLKELRAGEGLSWEEVGDRMGRSNAACRKRWQRLEGRLCDREAAAFAQKLSEFMTSRRVPARHAKAILGFVTENYG